MPVGFNSCVKRKGRVRRVSGPSKEHGLKRNEYVNFCFIDGKSFRGEVKKKTVKKALSKKERIDVLDRSLDVLKKHLAEIM